MHRRLIKLNVKELVIKANHLLGRYGDETEVEIHVQNVYSDGEDAEANDIQIRYDSEKDKIIIYG
jgi:hypothetical protein